MSVLHILLSVKAQENTSKLTAAWAKAQTLYFGPKPPKGKEANWVQTVPGKAWFVLFRTYGPLKPWFDKTWQLNDFELVK